MNLGNTIFRSKAKSETTRIQQLDAETAANFHLAFVEGGVGAGARACGPVANGVRTVLFKKMKGSDDIALRLRHLLAIGVEYPAGDAGVAPRNRVVLKV
ncbi:unannotated protein [freshwater metagenome]|uniref:Unannotated protein n=1 Tax=freshwater metagenome TaxID=449393 RepID=A0A6J6FRY2_9ZZZZ